MFVELKSQIARIDASCIIRGSVAGDAGLAGPYVVALLHAQGAGAGPRVQADRFVTQGGGAWVFLVAPGRYEVAAFRDVDGNLVYDRGEPYVEAGRAIDCRTGADVSDVTLAIPESGRPPGGATPALGWLQGAGRPASLGAATALGEQASLEDARFAIDVAHAGLWRPVDFFVKGEGGVYFLEPYDPRRIPVVFVHGIDGSPRQFAALVGQLDRSRFQPWIYYYASGTSLELLGGHLETTLLQLEVRHRVPQLCVVAHSMGGLVARQFLLRRAERGSGASVPAFITIATPWAGHAAAQKGVDRAPAVVPAWHDMAPGSEFLQKLYRRNTGAAHHLLFAYRGERAAEANDGVVTVASQLRAEAQEEAVRVHGIDDTHVGILRNPQAMLLVNRSLATTCASR